MTKNMLSLFKGFIVTKNKISKRPFKDSKNLMTFEEVKDLPEYSGVLAQDVVLVDFDKSKQADLFAKMAKGENLKCAINQTSRGKHGFFINTTVTKCYQGQKLACGLIADIKIGSKNSYVVLKIDGKERYTEQDITDGESYDKLPKWLLPVSHNIDFSNMEEGDGRNQSLFNYILTLTAADFTKRAARECIRLINKYVLTDPLTEDELDVILRDEAFEKDVFFKNKAFLFDKFAIALKNNYNVIKIFGQLHLYQDGIYVPGKEKIEHAMLQMFPQMNRQKRNEVYDYLKIIIQTETVPMNANLIAFRNGIYDIVNDTLLPFSPDYVVTNRIEWDYNPSAYSQLADEVLDNIAVQDKQIRALLEEIIGYTFYRRNELRKTFILTGEKSNGKSTYLEMIGYLLGEKNTCALDLSQLNEKFSVVELFGKLANIGDDISDEYISNTGNFKKLASGSAIQGEFKGVQEKVNFKSYAKMLFSANSIPRLGKGKDTAALISRLIFVPFLAFFDPKDPKFKPFIKDELFTQETMEYLIVLGIAGLKRVLLNRGFTESAKVQKSIEEYEETNNPILGFFKEMEIEERKIENEPAPEIYKQYREYCIRSGLQPWGNVEFSRQTCKHYKLKTKDKRIQGKVTKVFVADV